MYGVYCVCDFRNMEHGFVGAKRTLVYVNMVMIAVLVVNSVVSLRIFWCVIQKCFQRCQIQKWVVWIIVSSVISILNEGIEGVE